jgi:ABC-2 type transport system ATP-binding protein
MIRAEGLIKHFGDQIAVNAISFTVEKGEVLGLLGPNGAGKSTTMRILSGCLDPDAGFAEITGHDPAINRRSAQNALGYLPEGAPAYPAMTPRSFVRFHLRARGYNGATLKQAAERALERANLGQAASKRIGQLSKGYKRRAALAAAIAHDPPVLILDEPTDGLDPNQKDGVRAMILEMSADKAIIVSTHLLEEVDSLCTRTLVIAGGLVQIDTTPQDFAAMSAEGTIAASFRQLTASQQAETLKAEPKV